MGSSSERWLRLRRGWFSCPASTRPVQRVRMVALVRAPYIPTSLDTSGPVRHLLVAVAIFGWVAEQERTRLIERTRAGLDRARRQGKTLGRPRTSSVLLHAAAEDRQRRASLAPRRRARNDGVGRWRGLRRPLRAQLAALASPRQQSRSPLPRSTTGPTSTVVLRARRREHKYFRVVGIAMLTVGTSCGRGTWMGTHIRVYWRPLKTAAAGVAHLETSGGIST